MKRSSEISLEALMASMQAGDQSAAQDLLKAAWAIASVQARKVLRSSGISDQSVAEDIVQDTLLAIYEKRDTYDPSQPFVPWLLAITRYKTVDRLRRGKWNRTTAFEEGAAYDQSKHAATAQESARHDLERLMADLPERARKALELVKLDGYSHAEAAEKLGVGESAIKVMVHRAIKKLRGSAVTGKEET